MLVCNFVRLRFDAQLRTFAALLYDFADEVILTDEVFTVRFVATRLSPFQVYRAPIVRAPGDVTSRQGSSLHGFPAT